MSERVTKNHMPPVETKPSSIPLHDTPAKQPHASTDRAAKRRNTRTTPQPIRPTQEMGRTGSSDRKRWHILDDWLGDTYCGRIQPGDIIEGRLFDDLPDNALICGHCYQRFSWRPMPQEFILEDRGYRTPCRVWRRSLDAYGYGKRFRDDRWTFAHRDAYEAAYGPIPDGFVVHHDCEQKDCLEPAHMTAMSRADHIRLHRPETYPGSNALRRSS